MAEASIKTEIKGSRTRRMVITTIDSLAEMFKDYCGGDIPQDARAIALKLKPAEKGRLGILMESDEWPTSGEMEVRFEIKRFYGIGGGH